MKKISFYLFAAIAIACAVFAGKHETWESSVGSTIEGVFVGSIDSEHWIASNDGKLFKLKENQLSEKSLQRIEELSEKKDGRGAVPHLKHSNLMPSRSTPENEKLITTLCSSKLPSVNFKATPISSALDSLNEIAGSEVSFRLEGDIQDREVNIQLRNLYMNQILDFLTQQVGLYYQVESGEVVIRNQHR